MIKEIGMPKFGLSMETGIIAAWLVKEGDKVEAGQALAEINSEKLSNVCEAPEAGYIRKILANVDDELECGATICILADSMDEDVSAVGGAAAGAEPAPAAEPAAPATASAAAPTGTNMILMPKFGLSMEEGTIAAWLVKEGDSVTKGQAVAEVNSEKLTNNAESDFDGVVLKILLKEDETAECGTPIAIVGPAGTDVSGVSADAAPAPAAAASAPAAPAAAAPVAAAPAAGKDVKITPRAKKYADEKGLVYGHIVGTGIGGAITIDDVKKFGKPAAAAAAEAAPAAAPAAPAAYVAPADVKITRRAKAVADRKGWAYGHIKGTGEEGYITVSDIKRYGKPYGEVDMPAATAYDSTKPDVIRKMTPMEQAVCKGMMASLQGTAQNTVATEADISNLVSLYQSIKGKYNAAGVKLSYTAMIIKAVAMAMENHPDMRVSPVDDKTVRIAQNIDIGCAVDVPGGLIVPVIRNANMKDLRTISLELLDLTEKAKAGKLTAENMGGACITITNLGMFGITYFTPVLNSPESLILGVGSIIKQVIIRNGVMTPASCINFSLTHDHRVINGAPAARFLKEVVDSLKDFKWL